MKVQELIDALKKFKAEHGDLPVKDGIEYFNGVSGVELSEDNSVTMDKKWAVLQVVYDDDLPDDEI
jgi:hypothetical protein